MATKKLPKSRKTTPQGARAAKNGAAPGSPAIVVPKRYCASIYPGPGNPLDERFVEVVRQLEAKLAMPIWLLIQNRGTPLSEIDFDVFKGFQKRRSQIQGTACGLLIESPGGDAHSAYRIGRLFQRRASEFTAIIPQYAKSAATLLSLAADAILMSRDAELGPLDVQMLDVEKEDIGSALNSVQSLERLSAFGLVTIDNVMKLLLPRTGKKIDTLLPLILKYSTDFIRPLLEKIDMVDYTKKSRELKVAEEYAARLLKKKYPWVKAQRVARQFVEKFPTHGFVIDRTEAESYETFASGEWFGLDLNLRKPNEEIETLFEKLTPFLDTLTVIGRLKEI